MQPIRHIFPSLSLMLMLGTLPFTGCTKEDRKAAVAKQDQSIDAFISKLKCDTVYYKPGTSRAVLRQGSGDTLSVGDSVYFQYAGYTFAPSGKGSLFVTNRDSIAADNGFEIPQGARDMGKGKLGSGQYIYGLDKGLEGVRSGEYAYIIFNSDSGFGNQAVGIVPKMTPLLYEVWIERIVKN